MAPRFDDLSQTYIDALNAVRGVDHLAQRRRKRKERNHVGPGPAPRGHYRGEFLAPGPDLETAELGLGRLGTDRRANRFDGFG